jgi:hypothetical protein
MRPDLLTFACGLATGALALYMVGARNGEEVERLIGIIEWNSPYREGTK